MKEEQNEERIYKKDTPFGTDIRNFTLGEMAPNTQTKRTLSEDKRRQNDDDADDDGTVAAVAIAKKQKREKKRNQHTRHDT